MCPPTYYGIEYEINPWMSRSRQSDPQLARDQWQKLYRLLVGRPGLEIDLIEPRPGLPDMVFTANAGIVWGDKFIVSNFRHEVRQREAPYYASWFAARGYEVVRLPDESFFEGEGDLLLCGETFFAGYHIRTDIRSHQRVAEILACEILSLELTSEWFYHLDTCFCPLGGGAALFYPAAFDAYALRVLDSNIETLIAVTEEEAKRFACNAIAIGTDVIMNEGCPDSRKKLESMGYSVFEAPLGEFIKAGGSAKCLALRMPHAGP